MTLLVQLVYLILVGLVDAVGVLLSVVDVLLLFLGDAVDAPLAVFALDDRWYRELDTLRT
jgi:hypothetical protein